jgi:hypothetical protein
MLPVPVVLDSATLVDADKVILSSSFGLNVSRFFLFHLAEHVRQIYINKSGTGVIIATATGTTVNVQ